VTRPTSYGYAPPPPTPPPDKLYSAFQATDRDGENNIKEREKEKCFTENFENLSKFSVVPY
jgi:hypothetical protein